MYWNDRSPVYTAIQSKWLGQAPEVLAEITSRYIRILSTSAPDIRLVLSGLHHAALKGYAPHFAAFCASCGGQFEPDQIDQLAVAAELDLIANADEILDFILGCEPRHETIEATPLLLLGSLATVAKFGGAISLVEFSCGGGSRLLFDHYRYQFGSAPLSANPEIGTFPTLGFHVDIDDPFDRISQLLKTGMPRLIDRRGLSPEHVDLTDRDELQLYEAFLSPDDLRSISQLRAASEALGRHGRPPILKGDPTSDLLTLLTEAYQTMPPGNTLLLADLMQCSSLRSDDRQRVAYQVQSFVARLHSHKPVAWLQVDRLNPSISQIEARLHLFGWSDPEDRSVHRLAEASLDLRLLRWLG